MRVWDRGGVRPVLALHCSLAHGGEWTAMAEHLTGVTVIAPDLPGHGTMPLWDGQSDIHTESTRLAINLAEASGTIDVIGHSFGATVALRLALERPDLVQSVSLIEPVLFAAARAAESPAFWPFHETHAVFAKTVAQGDLAEAAAGFLRIWGDGSDWSSLPERQRRYITERIAQVVGQDSALMQDSAGLLAYMRLESLGVPVLLLEGTESPQIVGAIQSALAERLPQVQRVVVPGAGHMLPLTHPKEVALAVQAHLDGLRRAA
ncbi:MAG: alpha/beta fold hydrolase [Paracoccaceae bacterium]